jgi:hypothetical protein
VQLECANKCFERGRGKEALELVQRTYDLLVAAAQVMGPVQIRQEEVDRVPVAGALAKVAVGPGQSPRLECGQRAAAGGEPRVALDVAACLAIACDQVVQPQPDRFTIQFPAAVRRDPRPAAAGD